MVEEEEVRSDADNEEEPGDPSSPEDRETGNTGGGGAKPITDYEKQRLSRIKENQARLKALGLPTLASSFSRSVRQQQSKRKGKQAKKDKDDEYIPSDAENRVSSSSEGDEEEEEEEFQGKNQASSRSRRRASVSKGKVKSSTSKRGTDKKFTIQTLASQSGFVDDDEALQQAISLSLGGSVSSAVLCGPPNSGTDNPDFDLRERKRDAIGQKNDKQKKRRKSNMSRIQMTEDQVVIHFFQFDEVGKGKIALKDLQRVAAVHDFTWTDKEMAAMIHCFDSDRDGKVLP